MKRVDISRIIENDKAYTAVVNELNDRMHCDWNDKVHDSFLKYADQMQQYAQELHSIRCSVQKLNDEVEELGIDSMISEAKRLCGEVDKI